MSFQCHRVHPRTVKSRKSPNILPPRDVSIDHLGSESFLKDLSMMNQIAFLAHGQDCDRSDEVESEETANKMKLSDQTWLSHISKNTPEEPRNNFLHSFLLFFPRTVHQYPRPVNECF